MRIRAILLPLILGAAALVMACGFQDYVYLYPPTESSSGTLLALTHNTNNVSAYFRGYEVYYRIYLTSDTISPSAASSDASKIEASWSDVYPDQVIKRIKDAGYVSMVASLTSPVMSPKAAPLVTVASADVAKLVQASLDLASGEMKVTVPGSPDVVTTYHVRRNVVAPDSSYREFTDFTPGSDCDSSSGSYYWIRAYAFAYGFDGSLAPIYSTPTVLAATEALN
jgi:hypothetical protein